MPKERPSFRYRPTLRLRTGAFDISATGWGRHVAGHGAPIRLMRRPLRMPNRVAIEGAVGRSLTAAEAARIEAFVVSVHYARAYDAAFEIGESVVKATLSAVAGMRGAQALRAYHAADDETRERIRAVLREQGSVRAQVDEGAFSGMPPDVAAAFREWAAADCPEDPARMPGIVAATLGDMTSQAAAIALARPGRRRGRKVDLYTRVLAAECWHLWSGLTDRPATIWHKEGQGSPFIVFASAIVAAWVGRPMHLRQLTRLLRAERGFRYRVEIPIG